MTSISLHQNPIPESRETNNLGQGHNLQMTNFVGGHNDTAEAAGVLDDGHAVDLLQALVDDAGTSDVREAFTVVRVWGVEFRILVVKSRTIFTKGDKECVQEVSP